ncbi:hypothetical protein SISNIDRAFT_460617 [Sistotremastrum niveocremeum HHB9708]|uniref:Uncharacterized protein n=2 Tax=Sistotremastraceae TaxID=3402574 RepID=A0A164NGN4_9AGAM|nr:hypothetical protein SISNIDRAFT_460617 [Sistotremastrum niveocremeum HHB9708]KZT35613.1 hypothetical protein SISSUDRAFT_1051191 [Sistotremastrum suecicum HHB10207 ss-3]
MSAPEQPTLAQWLEDAITSLLSSPAAIHITNPPGGGGPGPIDLFDTRFDNTFSANVEAYINGKKLDNSALRAKLNSVQQSFSPETANFSNSVENDTGVGAGQVGLFFSWNVNHAPSSGVGQGEAVQVSLNAQIAQENGASKVTILSLVSGAPIFAL